MVVEPGEVADEDDRFFGPLRAARPKELARPGRDRGERAASGARTDCEEVSEDNGYVTPDPVEPDLTVSESESEGLNPLEARARGQAFVISIARQSRYRRLRKAGGCWRVPGLHFQEFELADKLEARRYNALCADCWPPNDELGSDPPSSEEESSVAVSEAALARDHSEL